MKIYIDDSGAPKMEILDENGKTKEMLGQFP